MQKLLVSEPSLTNFEEFTGLAREVWECGILTHNGPKVQELEKKLKDKWNIPHLSLVTNGTVAIEIAIRSLNLPKGSKILTTPFTWIATASSILWQQYRPIFIDIDPNTLNIDPSKIEEFLKRESCFRPAGYEHEFASAILAVHVFSNPCDVEEIARISEKYGLKVIYDGAHSVNVKYNGKDLSQWGDVTTHSYHATKLYNCGEGGSIIANNDELAKRIERLRFFGHDENKDVIHEGTNGKMHEISACIGIANLNMMDKSQAHRKDLQSQYKKLFDGLSVKYQRIKEDSYNYSYFPVIFESEEIVLKVIEALDKIDVIARRYFYPSVNEFKIYQDLSQCPISEDISRRIVCLPCHDRVNSNDVNRIVWKIRDVLENC
jgi:dTDP-4-amino-4,6-dideoxygalactose transaminase